MRGYHRPKRLSASDSLTANDTFRTAVLDVARELGAKPPSEPWLGWTLQTRAGPLTVLPVPSLNAHGGFVAMRFEDVDRACDILNPRRETNPCLNGGLNPFSGKWNLSLFDMTDPEAIRRELRLHLRKVL